MSFKMLRFVISMVTPHRRMAYHCPGPRRPAALRTTQQRRCSVNPGGGTYAAERRMGYKALRQCGYS